MAVKKGYKQTEVGVKDVARGPNVDLVQEVLKQLVVSGTEVDRLFRLALSPLEPS